jgi:ParB-like chromosome segregation protein Spo0J
MRVEQVELGKLKPYDNNAKLHTRAQIDAVKASIREFGFRCPMLAWHDADGQAEIVAGHARAQAARELGMDEVPVIFVDDLTDAQRRALTLADNETSMMTGWDEDMLAYELDVLSQDVDMSAFGFDLQDGDASAELAAERDDVVTVTLRMPHDMYDEYEDLIRKVGETRYSEGNGAANRVMEALRRCTEGAG